MAAHPATRHRHLWPKDTNAMLSRPSTSAEMRQVCCKTGPAKPFLGFPYRQFWEPFPFIANIRGATVVVLGLVQWLMVQTCQVTRSRMRPQGVCACAQKNWQGARLRKSWWHPATLQQAVEAVEFNRHDFTLFDAVPD